MYSKKINQLATNLNPQNTDLIPIGDPTTGQLKTITYNQLVQSGGVPTTRQLTINGTTYDLSANRSWSVGTVTSVNMSVPTGLTISGNPITTSGTLAVGLQSGYSIPTTANQANWTTAYNDSIISAGVTGTTTKTLTLNQQDGGSVTASWTDDNTDAVTSVFGRTGAITAQSGDYTTTQVTEGTNLYYTDLRARAALSSSATGLTYNNTTGVFTLTSNYIIPTTTEQSNWTTAYNDSIISAAVTGTTTKTLTLNQQDGGTVTASWTDINTDAVTSVFGRTGAVIATEGDYTLTQLGDVTITTPTNGQVLKYNGTTWINNTDTDTGLTSVGLSMPVAFSVANTPLTANGTLAVSAIGTASQYIRGDGQLATFPSGASGGSSVNYYLNGSVNQGTIGGSVYYEMNRNAVIGAGTDFIRTNLQGDGLIAQFITDANDPNRLEIPSGAWNFEMYFSSSSAGGTPGFYIELLKYDGTTFTSIANGSTNPEGITGGTSIDLYLTSLAVPQTTLLTTDRLAIRVYVITSGKDITLHTEDNNLCEIITTFAGGIAALNGLTANTQYLAVGTSGTDFAISSVSDTHTFNLPTASATNRGALSSTDWTTFNNKQNALTNPVTGTGTTNYLPKWTSGSALGDSAITDDGTNVTINGSAATYKLKIVNPLSGSLFQSGIEFIRTTVSGGSKIEAFRDAAIGGVGLSFQVTANNAAEISATYTQAMTLDASGNLLVGTTTPLSNASGRGNITINGTDSVLAFGNSASSAGYVYVGSSNMEISAIGSKYINFNTNGSERLRITSGGNLLIGTTTDSGEKLQVTGDVVFKSNTNTVCTINSNGGAAILQLTNNAGTQKIVGGLAGQNSIDFYTNSVQRMKLDASGNLGLGVTPSTWASIFNVIEGPRGSVIAFQNNGNSLKLGSNFYFTGANYNYINTNAAARYDTDAEHRWYNAPSGTAGNAITFTQAMTLTNGGNLLIGTTADNGDKFQVNGSVYFNGAGLRHNIGATYAAEFNSVSGYNSSLNYLVNNTAYFASQVLGDAGSLGDYRLYSYSAGEVLRLKYSTGAATFSSSVTASSLIKSGGTSAQILAADGSVITAGTNITISGGTISSSGGGSITLTTTGTSGAATLVGFTLNIPQYQAALNGTGFVKISGTTISYDNSTYLTTSAASSTYQTILTNPVTGTGTTNQIAYWTSASAIGALTTATYPSLTELSYVKGVTSAIQTQINGKQAALSGTGFVKISGTTISYDNSTYLTTAVTSIAGTTNQIAVSAATGAVTVSLPSAVTISGAMTASGFFESSDERLKDIIKRDGDVVYFKWKSGDDKTHIGYIAQEVQLTHPDQVAESDGHLTVNYTEILVEKVRVLEKELANLKNKYSGV